MASPQTERIGSFLSLPTSGWGRLWLGVTLGETIVDGVLVGILLANLSGAQSVVDQVLARNETSVLPVYLGLFLLAHLFSLVLSYSALRPTSSSTIQLLGLALFNALFLGFACVAVVDAGRIISVASNHPLQTLIIFIPVMIGITELVYVVALYPIFREIGWLQYKSYGGDRLVKSMLLWYQICIVLLRVDLFLFIAFSLQLVLLVQQADAERWITIAAAPVTLLILLVGYFGVRREQRGLLYVFLAGCVLGAGYFVFKVRRRVSYARADQQLVQIYRFRDTTYFLVYKSLTAFVSKATQETEKDEQGRYMLDHIPSERMSID